MVQRFKKGRMVLLFLLLFMTGCRFSPGGQEILQTEKTPVITAQDAEIVMNDESDAFIWVHVCGQVVTPGVYSFSQGSRVFDAVEAAGGFTQDADINSVNLAQTLVDEGKVYIPAKDETEEKPAVPESNSGGKVNLNTADKEELLTLPGIGEKRADAILDLRKAKGGFQKIEELLEAEGIKEGIFEKIKDYIKV